MQVFFVTMVLDSPVPLLVLTSSEGSEALEVGSSLQTQALPRKHHCLPSDLEDMAQLCAQSGYTPRVLR